VQVVLQRLKALMNAKIANVQEGKVCTISGIIVGGSATVIAPVTSAPAVYYMVGVDGSSPYFSEGDGRPFAVEDPSGKILVDPRGAIADFAMSHADQFGAQEPGVLNFLATRDVRYDWIPAVSSGISHVRQWRLVAGTKVTISGAAFSTAMQQIGDNHRETSMQLMFRSNESTPLTIRWR
jgi:hypothetical protein